MFYDFVWFDSFRPIKTLSVFWGRGFLGWTSTKLWLMCLAQGHNTVTPARLKPSAPRSRVKHSTTEPQRSRVIYECTSDRRTYLTPISCKNDATPSNKAVCDRWRHKIKLSAKWRHARTRSDLSTNTSLNMGDQCKNHVYFHIMGLDAKKPLLCVHFRKHYTVTPFATSIISMF